MEESVSRAIVRGFADKLEACLNVDVAIVGAGPSGLVCAAILAAEGRKVAIFERRLAPGGGVWGGAMLNNDIIVQKDLCGFLDECGMRWEDSGEALVRVDSVEAASALIYRAVHTGATLFNAMTVEDVVYKEDRVAGIVINWTPVLREGMHVDPLAVMSRAVLDATGHDARLTAKVAEKAGIKLRTPTGGVAGEKPMWAEVGERATEENTCEVYPGLFVSGMAANGVFGAARMGPIFGGMFRSGQKAARLISKQLAKV